MRVDSVWWSRVTGPRASARNPSPCSAPPESAVSTTINPIPNRITSTAPPCNRRIGAPVTTRDSTWSARPCRSWAPTPAREVALGTHGDHGGRQPHPHPCSRRPARRRCPPPVGAMVNPHRALLAVLSTTDTTVHCADTPTARLLTRHQQDRQRSGSARDCLPGGSLSDGRDRPAPGEADSLRRH